MPWVAILNAVAPSAIGLVVSLIQKEAQGKEITAADWRGLVLAHAGKSAKDILTEQVTAIPGLPGPIPGESI